MASWVVVALTTTPLGRGSRAGPATAKAASSRRTAMSDETVEVPVALLRKLREESGAADATDSLIALIPPPRKRPTDAAIGRLISITNRHYGYGMDGLAARRILVDLHVAGGLAPEWMEDE